MIPNFQEIHTTLIRADTKVLESGTGILDESWRIQFQKFASDILRHYKVGYISVRKDSPIMHDPSSRKPRMNAPNQFIIPCGPFGRAPTIINSTCNLSDVQPEMIMEPLVFTEFEQMLRENEWIDRSENFGHWYQKEYALAHQLLHIR